MQPLAIGMFVLAALESDQLGNTPSRGFTLIEILIVLVIIGIVITFAVLATGDLGQTQNIEASAKELDLLIGFAQQRAILQPVVLGLSVQEKGYRFFEFQYDAKKSQWRALERDKLLYYHTFPPKTLVTLKPYNGQSELAASPDSDKPSIIISPSSNMTPFIIEMGKLSQPPLFRITGQPNGELNFERLK
jgi:general secretion pathway protein H